MIEACREVGVLLSINLITRYSAVTCKGRDLVDQGVVGKDLGIAVSCDGGQANQLLVRGIFRESKNRLATICGAVWRGCAGDEPCALISIDFVT